MRLLAHGKGADVPRCEGSFKVNESFEPRDRIDSSLVKNSATTRLYLPPLGVNENARREGRPQSGRARLTVGATLHSLSWAFFCWRAGKNSIPISGKNWVIRNEIFASFLSSLPRCGKTKIVRANPTGLRGECKEYSIQRERGYFFGLFFKKWPSLHVNVVQNRIKFLSLHKLTSGWIHKEPKQIAPSFAGRKK